MDDAPLQSLRLLLIEDNESDANLILREFKRADKTVAHQRVQNANGLRHALTEADWDAVICDFVVPGFDPDTALEILQELQRDLPVILVSGTIPDQDAVRLMRLGAHDYILKDNLARLVPATMREVKEATERRSRREAEAALEQSRSLYHSLVETMPAAVFRADQTGKFLFANSQLLRFCQCTREELFTRSVLFPHDAIFTKRQREIQQHVLSTGETLQTDESLSESGKTSRYIEMICAPVRATDGTIVGTQGLFWDITARKQAEEKHRTVEAQLRQAQKMEAIGQLSGGVAHDFNNLLTVIQCHTSLMHEEGALTAEQEAAVTQIEGATQRAANLTRQLLAFSRNQTSEPEHLLLNESLQSIARMVRRIVGENIAIKTKFCPSNPVVLADPVSIDQILLNLVVNARDAMPHGGTLQISTNLMEISEETAEEHPDAKSGSFVRVAVEDTGTGMPETVLSSIFDPFFTTKDVGKGTGLGLTTVYGIVRQHNGWITVQSRPGEGTRFEIFLPNSLAEVAPRRTAESADKVQGGTETVLLVEDETPLRSIIGSMLRNLGYQIHEARDGVEGCEIWEQAQADIDLVLTDVVMPRQLSGTAMVERMRTHRPNLPVVFVTGYNPDTENAPKPDRQLTRYIAKPFTPQTLARAVRELLDQQATPAQGPT